MRKLDQRYQKYRIGRIPTGDTVLGSDTDALVIADDLNLHNILNEVGNVALKNELEDSQLTIEQSRSDY